MRYCIRFQHKNNNFYFYAESENKEKALSYFYKRFDYKPRIISISEV